MIHTYHLVDFVGGNLFAWLLVFTRIGAAMMFLPGIGETFVSTRARLLLGLAIALLLAPLLGPQLPPMPTQPASLMALLVTEATMGVFLGVVVRLMITALDFAGQIISLQMGIGSAQAFNPAMSTQGSLPGTMMGTLALVLIFTTNLHHVFITGLVASYNLMPPMNLTPGPGYHPFQLAAMTQSFTSIVGQSFNVAIMVAAPFIVLGTIFQASMGLLARLQPSLQIYFVAMPIQVYFGLLVFAVLIGSMMSLWLAHTADVYHALGLS